MANHVSMGCVLASVREREVRPDERAAIEAWFRRGHTVSPMNGLKLKVDGISANKLATPTSLISHDLSAQLSVFPKQNTAKDVELAVLERESILGIIPHPSPGAPHRVGPFSCPPVHCRYSVRLRHRSLHRAHTQQHPCSIGFQRKCLNGFDRFLPTFRVWRRSCST